MSESPRPILDWQPVGDGDALCFERAAFSRCKPRRIARKRPGVLRVCLFGESLAAGFPLAPAFTPAIALEEMLKAALQGQREVEVIDLALPNMGPSEQLRVCEAAAQLQPDVCVFLTGNNWYYGLAVEPTASPEARLRYAALIDNRGAEAALAIDNRGAEAALAIEAQGVSALAATFRERLAARAQVMVKALVETARAAGAAVVLAIPPCNHEWERLNPPPLLGAGRSAAWFSYFHAAQQAQCDADHESVIAAAQQMARLEGDPGVSGTPQRLIARARRAQGRLQEARDAAMGAIDVCNWQNHTWALPQVPSYVAALLREAAAPLGYACVDVEQVFTAHSGSPLHGFRLFYDHCHLAVPGVQVAMAAVAGEVLQALGLEHQSMQRLLRAAPAPSAIQAASAAFQAAHWLSQFYPDLAAGDAGDRAFAALRESAGLDPLLLRVMRDHVRLRSLACAPELSALLPQAARVPGVAAALRSPRLNPVFLEALLQILGDHGAMAEVIASYDERLTPGIDLTQPRFGEWLWERTPIAWHDPHERQGAPLYRALWPESRFAFLCAAQEDLRLDLIWRSRSQGPVQVHLNGAPLAGCAQSGAGWQRARIAAGRAHLRRGLNRVSLRWPALALDEDAALQEAVKRLRCGADADLFPLFGEVFSLRVHR